MKYNNSLAIFVLGIGTGILIWNFLGLWNSQPAHAEATSGSAEGLIAVTGMVTNNTSGLWVIDARDTETSPALCLYIPESNGRTFRLVGARRIKYDLQIIQTKDSDKSLWSPSVLKKDIQEINAKAEEKEKEKGKK